MLSKICLLNMVSSHLSPAAFTTALLPLMKATAMDPEADVRIVNASDTHLVLGLHSNLTKQLSSMAHRWIKDPRYKTFESINSDFSSTRNPKTSLYGQWSRSSQTRGLTLLRI